ncbi:MAG: biotin/lipoyl-containing protein [Bacilli bacterium]
MKKYKVKVNGKLYEVELEAVEEVKGNVEAIKAKEKPAEAPVSKPVSNGEGKQVLAPIGGAVLKVNVKVGDSVKKGDVLLVIEAMKLENEVVAPCEGTIKDVKVSKGANVQTKDLLVVIG